MKKIAIILVIVLLTLSLCACGNDTKRADELSRGFISAMLVRDEAAMKQYLHPDYTETAMPDDEFYGSLAENYFFTLGNELTSMYAVGKSDFPKGKQSDIEGEQTVYAYIIMTNELYYNVELRVLENDNGYGIVAVSMSLNTDPSLYAISEGE